MLVLTVVQNSNELRMMEQYAAPLLAVAKADDTNAKLQGKYNQFHIQVLWWRGKFGVIDFDFVFQSSVNGWSLWRNFALKLAAFLP